MSSHVLQEPIDANGSIGTNGTFACTFVSSERRNCTSTLTFLNPALFSLGRTHTDWQIAIATPNGQENVGVYPQT